MIVIGLYYKPQLFPKNIRFGWIGLSGINTLARLVIKLYKLGPECYFTTAIKA
jgi:hypothetical protein